MRYLATALLALALSSALRAQPSPAPAVPLPDSYHLVYEHVISVDRAGGAHPGASSRLEVTAAKFVAKLKLDLTEQGKPRTVAVDPWPEASSSALWGEISRARVFEFKPQTGAGAPDFGEVRLSVEAIENGKSSATSLSWNAPLRNDGQVWALLNHLDGLMDPRAHEPGGAAPPAAGPVEPPGGTPTAPPGPPASPFPSEQPIFTPAPPAAP